ncbi:MAG: metalloprotease TldD [Gammaproteobacteria bacterium]|jgi:TldD protein|nr:metalloprotease TldD [Gammaproteobacteria bacterium]
MLLSQVEDALLFDNGLTRNDLDVALQQLFQHRIDFADIYLQFESSEMWSMEEGIVKDGSFSIAKGLGVRAIHGEKTGFAYADHLSLAALKKCAATARNIVSQGQSGKVAVLVPCTFTSLYPAHNPIREKSHLDKVEFLHAVDTYTRSLDPRVIQVMASLSAHYELILIAASDGTYAADVRPLVRLNVSVVMEEEGKREQGYSGGGGRKTYSALCEDTEWQHFSREAVRIAGVNLRADAAPAGIFDVVLGAGWPGVLLHEAVGHGLEGDFNRKGSSAFSGKMGEMVASSLCTIVDDGTLPGRRGSLNMDDEGVPTQQNVLIENGRLSGYLFDKLNARLMNQKSTGNGRRESYSHLPMPRMTNTYMLPGEHVKEDIIASLENGLYAVNFNGGQVDITSGKFVFVTSEAYWVKNGKIIKPVKGVTLIGDGPSALKRVSMVGNDLQLDLGVGICGKEGQSVPVGVGQPTLRINGLTVGGAA